MEKYKRRRSNRAITASARTCSSWRWLQRSQSSLSRRLERQLTTYRTLFTSVIDSRNVSCSVSSQADAQEAEWPPTPLPLLRHNPTQTKHNNQPPMRRKRNPTRNYVIKPTGPGTYRTIYNSTCHAALPNSSYHSSSPTPCLCALSFLLLFVLHACTMPSFSLLFRGSPLSVPSVMLIAAATACASPRVRCQHSRPPQFFHSPCPWP